MEGAKPYFLETNNPDERNTKKYEIIVIHFFFFEWTVWHNNFPQVLVKTLQPYFLETNNPDEKNTIKYETIFHALSDSNAGQKSAEGRFLSKWVYKFCPSQKLVHLSGYSPLKSHMGVVNFPKIRAKSSSL